MNRITQEHIYNKWDWFKEEIDGLDIVAGINKSANGWSIELLQHNTILYDAQGLTTRETYLILASLCQVLKGILD